MATEALRTLFCVGNNQNFFDLPKSDIGPVWEATQEFLGSLRDLDGVDVIGTMDDDAHMVGPSDSYPWTFYILLMFETKKQSRKPATCCAPSWLANLHCGSTSKLKLEWAANSSSEMTLNFNSELH